MKRRAAAVLAAAFAAVACWQIATALWIPAKAVLAQVLLHRAWDRTMAGERHVRPWPWADTWPVARLRVPARGIDQIVLAGATGRTLAFGPGHVDGTPLPGASGDSVIGGHRDTSLRFLAGLRAGDRILVDTMSGRTIAYRVAGTAVADGRKPFLAPDDPAPMLTLVTCWPFDALRPGGPMRYLVFAKAE